MRPFNIMRNMPGSEKKAKFIEQYADFIAGMGRSLNSPAWWATWLASRDAFASSANFIFESIFLGMPAKEFLKPDYGWRFVSHVAAMAKSGLKMTLHLLFNTRRLKKSVQQQQKKWRATPIHVIKTFGFEKNFEANRFSDPYFPGLAAYLRTATQSPVLTVCDVIGAPNTASRFAADIEGVVALQAFMRWWDVPRSLLAITRGLLTPLPRHLVFAGQDVTTLIHRLYRFDLLSRDALYSFCVRYAFQRLAQSFVVKSVTMTCENHPWERMAISALRATTPSLRITSYQHSVVHEGLINMYLGQGEVEFAPVADRLLTVGEITAQNIVKYGRYGNVPVRAACALRFGYLHELAPRAKPAKDVLLVVLSGITQGAELLDYVLAQASDLAGWKIVIREHPALKIADLAFRNSRDYKLESIPNLELSQGHSIVEDLMRSSAVLYHSSTAALEALQLGIPVIYYDDQRLLSVDPAQDCPELHWQVSAKLQLRPTLAAIKAASADDLARQTQKARQFVARYFYKVTPESLKEFTV